MTSSKEWPFNDLPTSVAIVDKLIITDGNWISYVSHDSDDGVWQFHSYRSEPLNADDAMLLGLEEVYKIDSSIGLLADLPLGWCAWRAAENSLWMKSPQN
ncbi:hypothetical protein [Pantoea endophytica]